MSQIFKNCGSLEMSSIIQKRLQSKGSKKTVTKFLNYNKHEYENRKMYLKD